MNASGAVVERDGLVNRALAKATGANIHDIRVLCGYYRSAVSLSTAWRDIGAEEQAERRAEEIRRYEAVLEHFAHTGKFPTKFVLINREV
jgi:hypothetical protein